ncbi:MAG: heavy-metal-associated domain-containing protein, partial [Planctomycetes bacterium]|nr:heavy-metal-associated domain-containing protein [Planctomycetota bacterium]
AAVNKTLKKVPGVSGIACDRNGKTVLFRAKDAAAAKKGIVALAKAGFHGSAVYGKKALPFPKSGAKKGTKAAQATFGGVHLCCSACVTAARKSLSNVPGVESIDIDRKEKTVTVRGKAIDITAAVKALNKGGFHALLQPPKKKK